MYGISTAGDWNADGRPDIALSGGGRRSARVWIVYGHRYSGTVKLARLGKKGALIRGRHIGEQIGIGGIAGGADVDGDGRPDVVIGTPYANRDPSDPAMGHAGGGAWLLRGSRSRRRSICPAPADEHGKSRGANRRRFLVVRRTRAGQLHSALSTATVAPTSC